jgi:hypothetical protein
MPRRVAQLEPVVPVARMDDHPLVLLEPPVHRVPTDAREARCETVLVDPGAVAELKEPHMFGLVGAGRTPPNTGP